MTNRLGPVSPKAHGAWLGAGSGSYVANTAIGLLQSYVTHAPLSPALVTLIYGAASVLLAFAAAWVLPALPASLVQQVQTETFRKQFQAAAGSGHVTILPSDPVLATPLAEKPVGGWPGSSAT